MVSALVARSTPAIRSRALSLQSALLAVGAVAIAVATVWSGDDALQVAGGDYAVDYQTAMNALLDGCLHAFFANVPDDGGGGTLLLRAPFAGLAKLTGGDQLLMFRFGALACLLALGALGLWLASEMGRRGVPLATRVGLVAICAATPGLFEAVSIGHPEEPLGAALCVAAVLLAGADRALPAGLMLGAAVINKPWGVLAVGPVLLCAPTQLRRLLAPACAVVGCWLLGSALLDPARLLLSIHDAEISAVAHPQDLWWPLRHMDGPYPVPPAALSAHARQLALALALGAALAVTVRARRTRTPLGTQSCLALLCFGFALRCLLEPSAHGYYQVPLLIALAAWEIRARRSVTISLASVFLLTFDFGRLNESATATAAYVLYLALLSPICAMLVADMVRAPRRQIRADARQERSAMRPRRPGWPRRSRSPSGAGSAR